MRTLTFARLRVAHLVGAACASIALATSATANAAGASDSGGSVVIWPTLTPAGDGAPTSPLHRPEDTKKEHSLSLHAHEIDATLRDAVQDLGFTLFVADPGPIGASTRDTDLIERAARSGTGESSNNGTWVVSPRIEEAGGDSYIVRIVVVPPGGHELRVRVETIPASNLAVKSLVMLRDLLAPSAAQAAQLERERERLDDSARAGVMSPLRSQGRSVLAINSALFGGFLAFSVQSASDSSDPRVLYPLLALGTGVGIGSALLVAEEWDVTTGNAWFLSAGAWWGAGSGILIANGASVVPLTDRYTYGIAGGLLGLGLATTALVKNRMDEGDAMLAHSGGGLGLLWGGLSELLYRGVVTGVTPQTGMGYGSAIGLVGAGLLATAVSTTPSRVLLIDLGVGLGGLAGAAAASPAIFENVTEGKARTFLGVTLAGSLAGGVLTGFLTRNMAQARPVAWRTGVPSVGVIGASETAYGRVPAYGLSWQGRF